MAIKPKQILDTAVGLGKSAVSAAEKRLRRDGEPETSGSPTTVGAAKPGAPGGHKSATAATSRPRASKPAKRKSTAEAAKRGATGSGSGKAKAKTAPKAERSATPKAAVERGKAAPQKDKTSTPRKRATGRRSTASQAAATSGKEVADAASRKSD